MYVFTKHSARARIIHINFALVQNEIMQQQIFFLALVTFISGKDC